MSYRNKLFSLGLENDQTPTEGGEATVDTGAQELLEVNEVAAEIDQTHEAMAEAEDSAEQLEEVAASMEAMVNSGRGLSADAAMMAHHAVGFATRKFGITAPMPAMESFATVGASGQLQQTRASLEGIKDTILKIWNWIKAQFGKLRAHLKDFWLKTFDGAVRLKKRAEAMAKKAEGITTSASGDKANVTVPADLVGKLHIGGALKVEEGIATLKAVSEQVLGKIDDARLQIIEKVVATINSADFSEDQKLASAIAVYSTEFEKLEKVTVTSVFSESVASNKAYDYVKEAGSLLKAKGTKELPGGQQLVAVSTDAAQINAANDDIAALKAVGKSRGVLGQFAEKAPEPKEKKEPTLPASKIVTVCEEVAGIAGTIEAFRRNFQNQEKAKDAFTTAGKHVESEAAKAEKLSADGQKLASAFVRSIMVIPQLIDQPAQKFAQYTVSTLNSALNYAQLSLSQYK